VKNKRRKFLKESLKTTFGILLGADIIYENFLPKNMLPIAILEDVVFASLPGKSDLLRVLNDRPINAETPPHLLNDLLTPNNLFFVRNNGIPPVNIDPKNWSIVVEGESAKSTKTYTINSLKEKFDVVSLNLTLECGGNGRKEFSPPAKGNQWSTGAVGCAKWTGVRLKDVLRDVGMKDNALYIGYYGSDTHLSGDPNKNAISRGVPITKALETESMIAWSMNDQDIPLLNGYPLRLVFGGYPASCSGKWLNKIVIRDRVHDGQKMSGASYRIPCDPVAPGSKVNDEDMCIIENMPVKSLITYPKTGAIIKQNQSLPFNGKAWTSAESISKVEYSIDFGRSWSACDLSSAQNRYEWQAFSAETKFEKVGYYEVWARAIDSSGDTQPIILPGWNPKGYLNNACHRIAIKVEK
jgi:DMSO/TMAO reductase YedYZ molybdopterin-dependent catalytic subunit